MSFEEDENNQILNTDYNRESKNSLLLQARLSKDLSEIPVKKINKCEEKMKEWSIFKIRFGVYIYNKTSYVSKFAIATSIMTFVISALVILPSFFQISEVSFCCNVTHEKLDDKIYVDYNV